MKFTRQQTSELYQLRRATLLSQITVRFRAGFYEASWKGRAANRCFSPERDQAVNRCLGAAVPPHKKPSKPICKLAGKKQPDTLTPFQCWYGDLEEAA